MTKIKFIKVVPMSFMFADFYYFVVKSVRILFDLSLLINCFSYFQFIDYDYAINYLVKEKYSSLSSAKSNSI